MKNIILTIIIFICSSHFAKAQLDTVNYNHWYLELKSYEVSLDSTNMV
jgi:hypothetical protein